MIIKLIHKSKQIQTCSATFADAAASPAQVTSVGSQIFSRCMEENQAIHWTPSGTSVIWNM